MSVWLAIFLAWLAVPPLAFGVLVFAYPRYLSWRIGTQRQPQLSRVRRTDLKI